MLLTVLLFFCSEKLYFNSIKLLQESESDVQVFKDGHAHQRR